jgi:hypothetical protein
MGETFSVHLDKVTEAVIAAIPDATFKAMEHVHSVAVELAPLQDGDLRGSAATVNSIDRHGASVVFDSVYARYQEYGVSESGKELRHDTGQSFYLITALEQETPKALEILTNELRKVIE